MVVGKAGLSYARTTGSAPSGQVKAGRGAMRDKQGLDWFRKVECRGRTGAGQNRSRHG